jgi:hypothetical protein
MRSQTYDRILPCMKYPLVIGWSPKCACTFFKRWWWFLETGTLWELSTQDHHEKLHVAVQNRAIRKPTDREIVVIGIRHPASRLRSAYVDKIANPANKSYYRPGLLFEQWVDELHVDRANRHEWGSHWNPQVTMFERLPDAYTVPIDVGDDLEPSVRKIENMLGLPAMECSNTKKTTKMKPVISNELAGKIADIYQDDFEWLAKYYGICYMPFC